MGSSDGTFHKKWDDIIREAESKLLSHQIQWVTAQRSLYQKLAAQKLTSLREAMSSNPESLHDAESAITTVSNRVRADILTAERKKYAIAIERFENEQFGTNQRRLSKPKQSREPQPGPSNTKPGRTFKQAKRQLGPKGGQFRGSKNNDKNAISNLLNLLLKK